MKYYAFLFIFISLQTNAQWNPSNPLLVSAEDCPVAMRLCDATQEYNFQLAGDGLIDDAHGSLNIIYLPSTSPTQFESKICFVKFTPQYSGDLGLVICPENIENMQFQVFKNYNCNDIENGTYSQNTFISGTNTTTWTSDMGCLGLAGPGSLYNPYNPGINSPNFKPFLEPLVAGLDYLIIIQIGWHTQAGSHRFTLRFTGPVVTAHPDVFYHPDCALATEEVIKTDDFVTVSPNPFTEKFTINSLHAFEKMALYDVSGKLILTQTFAKTIEIKNLSQGVYFLHLIDAEGNKVVKKLVKE